MTTTPKHSGIYLRISKDDEGKEGAGLGVQRQEGDCRELAARLGWEIAGVYCDNDTSAHSGVVRKAYNRMLRDIKSGALDGVIVWHTDRLHRRIRDLDSYITVIENRGKNDQGDPLVQTETVRSGRMNLSDATGMFLARTLANNAQFEVDHLIERVKAAKKQHRDAGRLSGAPVPFGYRSPIKAAGSEERALERKIRRAQGLPELEIHEAEAEAIRECYRRIIEHGGTGPGSLSALCRWINGQGFTSTPDTRRGGGSPWTVTTLRRTLLRASRAGLIEHDFMSKDADDKTVHDFRVTGTGNWPPIVDRATWETARAILTAQSRRTTPGPAPRWLLSGRASALTCGVCEGTWFVARKGASRGRYGYSCMNAHVRRDVQRTDALVSAAVIKRIAKEDAASILHPSVDMTKLIGRLDAIRGRLNALAGDRRLDYEQIAIMSEPLHREKDAIEAQLPSDDSGVLGEVAGELARIKCDDEAAREAEADAVFWGLTLEQQRAIVKATVKVTILPTRSGKGHPIGATWFDPDSVVIEPRW